MFDFTIKLLNFGWDTAAINASDYAEARWPPVQATEKSTFEINLEINWPSYWNAVLFGTYINKCK